MKKLKILKLSPDSRYLQKLALNYFQYFERFCSRLGGQMLKTRKNTIRNQFEQQWFNFISFQKPRRVYTAI